MPVGFEVFLLLNMTRLGTLADLRRIYQVFASVICM